MANRDDKAENSQRESELSVAVKPERHNLLVDYELVPSPLPPEVAATSCDVPGEVVVLNKNEIFAENSLDSLEVELDAVIAVYDEHDGAVGQVRIEQDVLLNADAHAMEGNAEELKDVLPAYSLRRPESQVNFQITPPAVPPIVLYSAPPLQGAPPTYSATMRIGTDDYRQQHLRIFGRRHRMEPSPPFIAPIPPPSYAQSQGLCQHHDRPNMASPIIEVDDITWGSEPTSSVCPNCHNFVITVTHTRRSHLTHFTALTLCMCGCWPCCLLPYCIKSCKTIYHECPVCLTVIGMYNPW